MPWIILGIITSYLIGSIPTAFLFGKILKGIDIRKFGSGNIGATNALRVLGKGAGIAVLIIDVIKGAFPVIFIGDIILAKGVSLPSDILRILLGIACVFGHNWTVFLNFKGGKGVASTFGILIGLSLRISGFGIILGLTILTWVVTFISFRIVSLSSVIAAVALPAFMFLFNRSKGLIIFSFLIALFIILRHTPNLKRLFKGQESRLHFK
jgi:glycerol-3-phosphate acyltransferase PlsY